MKISPFKYTKRVLIILCYNCLLSFPKGYCCARNTCIRRVSILFPPFILRFVLSSYLFVLSICACDGIRFYAAYEYAKRSFQARAPPGQGVPVWATLASGSCGGMAYWLACYPLGMSSVLLLVFVEYLIWSVY